MMKFSVVANHERSAVYKPIHILAKWAESRGHEVFISPQLHENYFDPEYSIRKCASEAEAIAKSDIVMTSGGDGTILWAARCILDQKKLILGVNCGRMGFLANIKQAHLIDALEQVEKKNYTIDKRYMLEAAPNDGQKVYALNEILFSKKGTASMITLEVECGGVFVNRYWADGIMISTPTGSTAYNLSSGGPIVMPETDVIVLTPINPHTLTTRPIVLPGNKPVRIKISPEDQEVLFSNDGEISEITTPLHYVDVKRTDFTVDLIQLPGHSYFETLRTKLMWGADVREKL